MLISAGTRKGNTMTTIYTESARGGVKARRLFASAMAAVMLAGTVMSGQAAAATPPVFPNNIVIFPERDFLSLEGYQDKVGQQATITVLRGGEVSGRATGTIAAGDPALEVNHPGGVCWNGEIAPGIEVTPNIKPGDTVRVRFADGTIDSARTQNARVTGFRSVGSNQLVVDGRVGAAVNKAFMEQRIVAPDLKETDVGRRDIRAPQRPGPYTSTLAFPTASTFRATYTFNTDADTTAAEATQMRDIAAQGQMRVLAWMDEDPSGEREGLTIYEFEEIGGPGMGGCPAGPENTAPLAPRNVTATAGDASANVSWSDASTIPDGAAITGYRVIATDLSNGVSTSARFADTASATESGTVQNLINGREYRIVVRATSAAGPGKAAAAPDTVTPQAAPAQPAA